MRLEVSVTEVVKEERDEGIENGSGEDGTPVGTDKAGGVGRSKSNRRQRAPVSCVAWNHHSRSGAGAAGGTLGGIAGGAGEIFACCDDKVRYSYIHQKITRTTKYIYASIPSFVCARPSNDASASNFSDDDILSHVLLRCVRSHNSASRRHTHTHTHSLSLSP